MFRLAEGDREPVLDQKSHCEIPVEIPRLAKLDDKECCTLL